MRWAQRTSFNTLDNWGHTTCAQSKRRKDRKEKIKGHGPEHVYNTLGYSCKHRQLCVWPVTVIVWPVSVTHFPTLQMSHWFEKWLACKLYKDTVCLRHRDFTASHLQAKWPYPEDINLHLGQQQLEQQGDETGYWLAHHAWLSIRTGSARYF